MKIKLSDGNRCGVMDSSLNGYEYIGPFVYSRDGENLTLSSADMSCGRFVRVQGQAGLVPEYWSRDYLGSVRARDTAGEVKYYDYTPYDIHFYATAKLKPLVPWLK